LAIRAGKMELSRPLGTTRRVPQEKFSRKQYTCNKSFIDQACLVKMAVSVHKLGQYRGQYLAILTSHLVDNPYLQICGLFYVTMRSVNWTIKQFPLQHYNIILIIKLLNYSQ